MIIIQLRTYEVNAEDKDEAIDKMRENSGRTIDNQFFTTLEWEDWFQVEMEVRAQEGGHK